MTSRDLNVTEDDLLNAREHAKDLSLEETREVSMIFRDLPVSVFILTHLCR
jgi:hypothetical protein